MVFKSRSRFCFKIGLAILIYLSPMVDWKTFTSKQIIFFFIFCYEDQTRRTHKIYFGGRFLRIRKANFILAYHELIMQHEFAQNKGSDLELSPRPLSGFMTS